MEQKRPLVWLSADSDHCATHLPIHKHWQLTRINPFQIPTAMLRAGTRKPVGVCDLTSLTPSQLDNTRQWLEWLPVRSWLALVKQRQLDHPEVRRFIEQYCQDYHTLPLDWQRLANSLGHMWGMSLLEHSHVETTRAGYQEYVLNGPSQAIRATRSLLRRFAATDEPIVIYGESGTGREAAAEFVHLHSERKQQPLVYVNCAALPASLTQSELFGHERGAFTHALKARKGRIESAHGGTLVLSGADELSLEQQSVILRFLEEGKIEPVGSSRAIDVDVRIIATCTAPLERLVKQGSFRDDVFYRLGNLTVPLPPMRKRLEDLPYLVQRALEAAGGEVYRVDNATLFAMAQHNWPGNLRELQNRVSQAVLLARSLQIQPEDLGLLKSTLPTNTEHFTLDAFRARADQEAITTSLSLTRHNISAAARLLKISRVSFYRLLEKHKLQPPSTNATTSPSPGKGNGDLS